MGLTTVDVLGVGDCPFSGIVSQDGVFRCAVSENQDECTGDLPDDCPLHHREFLVKIAREYSGE